MTVSAPQLSDVLVVGSGLAGLSLALRLADHARVTVLAKAELSQGSSLYAQGGVAAVLNDDDSYESHIDDTLKAGAGLCHRDAVEFTVRHGPQAIRWLIEHGVLFTRENGPDGKPHYHLTREGGHGHRRVIHAADATGKALETTLVQRARSHPNIAMREHHIAIDVITAHKLGRGGANRALGLYALNKLTGKVEVFGARHLVLATGGASKVYLYTTNPDTSTGDGIAMAWRAGCRVANLEFVQFHPTCLYHPHAKSFLISEAVRGEGGLLKLPDGERFMPAYDPRAELAPRDVVARAIDYEMKKRGLDCVYLDISHKPARFIIEHFPNIFRQLSEWGIDMTQEPIPVVPAAHYTCGGVVTDMWGCTDLCNLYAVGEVAFTGLHGANRLASNSLLECLVFGRAAARHILENSPSVSASIPEWDESRVTDADEEIVISHNWAELRRFMWDYVGIVRTNKRLARAAHRIRLLQDEIDEFYQNFRVTHDLIELRNLVMTADLIVRSAMLRHESRGLHYSRDYPEMMPVGGNTVVNPRPGLVCPGVCEVLMPEM